MSTSIYAGVGNLPCFPTFILKIPNFPYTFYGIASSSAGISTTITTSYSYVMLQCPHNISPFDGTSQQRSSKVLDSRYAPAI